MNNEKIPTLADFMSSEEMSDMIKSQIKEVRDLDNEIVQVRSYLLDNFGPFGRSKLKIITGEEHTVDMVKAVINHFKK